MRQMQSPQASDNRRSDRPTGVDAMEIVPLAPLVIEGLWTRPQGCCQRCRGVTLDKDEGKRLLPPTQLAPSYLQ